MKRKPILTKLLLLLCGLFVVSAIYAQERKITGTVTNSKDKTPLPGATVVIKGTTMGTATDVERQL